MVTNIKTCTFIFFTLGFCVSAKSIENGDNVLDSSEIDKTRFQPSEVDAHSLENQENQETEIMPAEVPEAAGKSFTILEEENKGRSKPQEADGEEDGKPSKPLLEPPGPQCGLSHTMAWADCSPVLPAPCPTSCTTPDNCQFPYCDPTRQCKCENVWCKNDLMCHFFRIPCSGNFTCQDGSCICET